MRLKDHNFHLLWVEYDFVDCTECQRLLARAREKRASLDLPPDAGDSALVARYIYHAKKMSQT